MKKRYITGLIVMLLLITCVCTACGPNIPKPPYVNTVRMDALNYSMYVNKEISLVMNQLETHMANASMLKTKSISILDEITYLDDSIILTQEAIDSVTGIYPPETYDDDREAVLNLLNNALESLNAYKTYLQSGYLDSLDDYIDDMSFCFSSLSARFNNYTQ